MPLLINGVTRPDIITYNGISPVARVITSSGTVLWEKVQLPAKDTLESMTWADISTVCRAGKASDYWALGDLKTFTLDGVSYSARIIGFDHDDVADAAAYGRSKAGITFLQETVLPTEYAFSNTAAKCYWHLSDMRLTALPALLAQLDSALQAAIVPVVKITATSATESQSTNDALFMLAAREVLAAADDVYGIVEEGALVAQYAWFAAGNTALKNGHWMLRTKSKSTADYYTRVNGQPKSWEVSYNDTSSAALAFSV